MTEPVQDEIVPPQPMVDVVIRVGCRMRRSRIYVREKQGWDAVRIIRMCDRVTRIGCAGIGRA